jgi:hypothetical protein
MAGIEAWDDQTLADVACSKRELGIRSEVDADILVELGYDALAARLLAYDEKCRSYWEGKPKGAFVLTHRPLLAKTQVDRAGERSDLIEELAFLHSVNGASDYLSELLGAQPRVGVLEQLRDPIEAVLVRDEDQLRASATIRLIEPLLYPDGLGGLASFGEVARVFVLSVNWAKWRDREVRRLVSITSIAEEVWPAPDDAAISRVIS